VRVFGPKREELTSGWRNLYKYELIIRVMFSRIRVAGHVTRMGAISGRQSEDKESSAGPRSR
jgi:hypothetical protein